MLFWQLINPLTQMMCTCKRSIDPRPLLLTTNLMSTTPPYTLQTHPDQSAILLSTAGSQYFNKAHDSLNGDQLDVQFEVDL